MGTSFGETVCVLLETYSRCLSLLKGFRRTGKQTESQSRLGSSIRSDKAKIRRVYSARLSLRGGTFEKGDSQYSMPPRPTHSLTSNQQRLGHQSGDWSEN